MKDIKQLIVDLDWNKEKYIQERAMRKLEKIKGEDIILLANQDNELCSKNCWQNAAIVLKKIGYPRNRLALPYLMEWFQDINWPGVSMIIEVLKEIDKRILIPYIEVAIKNALKDNDEMWCNGLNYVLNELKIDELYFFNQSIYYEFMDIIE